MNEQKVIQHMIDFIEKKEQQVQNSKLASLIPSKNDVVKSVLDDLERVTYENQ